MSKFNVGDKVRIKGDLSKCEFGYVYYMDAYKGKKAIVVKVRIGGEIKLDIDKQIWNWSENVLELIKENDNMNVKIEEGNKVNESDLKDSEISKEVEDKKNCKDCDYFVKSSLGNYCDFYGILLNIMHGCNEFQLKKHKEGIKDIKTENIENDTINPFMEEYEKIVNETVKLCKRKNKDYGNATDESFKQFGDVSYQVRCFDKWSRINTLLKNGKAEVSESLEDSLLDLSNYLFLWVTSRRLKEK